MYFKSQDVVPKPGGIEQKQFGSPPLGWILSKKTLKTKVYNKTNKKQSKER